MTGVAEKGVVVPWVKFSNLPPPPFFLNSDLVLSSIDLETDSAEVLKLRLSV